MRGLGRQYHWKDINERIYKKFKNTTPIAGFYTFTTRAAFVMDLDVVKDIMIKQFQSFTDRGLFHNERDDPLTANLLFLDGERWRVLRHKVSPVFTTGKMKFMFPTVVQVGERLEPACLKFINSEDGSGIVEAKDLCARYTTDVIGYCAFGIECCSLKDPQQLFYIMSKRALLENNLGSLGVAFRGSFPKLARRLHMKDTVADVENFFLGTVRETVRYREENSIQRSDFMNLLLELKNNRVIKNETGDEFVNLTFNEIAAQAFLFLVAGSETSSNTMVFALYELALHQEVQDRARAEVQTVFEACNGEMVYETMSQMKYLKQVIDETLRLHTPLPVLNRHALEDYPVPGHPKYVIRKDMPVIIPAICLHRDEQYYPYPDVFNPDNFTPEQVALRDPVLYLPFGDGPRNCIGLRFAKMQMMVGLSLLLSKFKFTICERTPVPMKYDKENFMLTPEKDLYLKVSRI
uniref:Cytochrome P450 n=1 Tax=Musca domestica TaxID=7370 RepID=T1PAM1_MUSDO